MGYTTDFYGQLETDWTMKQEHVDYINTFCSVRHMQRNAAIAETFPDPVRLAAGLPIGIDGGYYVGNTNDYGQDMDASVKNGNQPPAGQPGLWCQWELVDNGQYLTWDGGEKFYNYVEWLRYLIEHFFEPWGYKLNGEIEWQGEERDDMGLIKVENNIVTTKSGSISYE
jgi:hypothetical protein